MKLAPLIILSLLSFSALSFSDTSTPDIKNINCENPRDTIEDHMCAGKESETATKTLNEVYKTALKSADPEKRKLLEKSQADWNNFLKSNCELIGDQARGGSIYVALVLRCQSRMSLERAKELTTDWVRG
jgi:uncharacterized protein YecT (DUF1311 family)